MARDEGELGREVALVDVQVRAADAGQLDPDTQLARLRLRRGHFAEGIAPRPVVQDGLHVVSPPWSGGNRRPGATWVLSPRPCRTLSNAVATFSSGTVSVISAA